MDCAGTVAIIGGAVACSIVRLEAASFTICAPMFFKLVFQFDFTRYGNISLVIVGAPKDLSEPRYGLSDRGLLSLHLPVRLRRAAFFT